MDFHRDQIPFVMQMTEMIKGNGLYKIFHFS